MIVLEAPIRDPARDVPLIVQSSVPFKDLSSATHAASPHLHGPFPAVVLEAETSGDNLGTRAVLNSLSATSFCIQLDCQIEFGKSLLVITQLSHAILLLRAEVTEVRQNQNGSYGACLRIKQHQILSSLTMGQALNIDEPSVKEPGSSESFPRFATNS